MLSRRRLIEKVASLPLLLAHRHRTALRAAANLGSYDRTINVKAFGAVGDNHQDDTSAIQGAAVAFQSACQAGAAFGTGAPIFYFPGGNYRITAPITVTNCSGGIIAGDGMLQSRILGSAGLSGQPAMLRLVNCSYTVTRDLGLLGAPSATTLQADSGERATAIRVASAAHISPGQTLGIIRASGSAAESVVVKTVVAGLVTLTSATTYSYSAGDAVCTGVLAGWQSYRSATEPGPATHNRCERVLCGSFARNPMLYAFAIDCEGGTGSPSDAGNDCHSFEFCQAVNAAVAGLRIGHKNALAIHVSNTDLQGANAIEMVTGGSFVQMGGMNQATAWDYELGGNILHACSVFGTLTESGSGLLHAAETRQMRNLQFKAVAYDKTGGPGGTGRNLIDVTGTTFDLQFVGCFLAAGAGGKQLTMRLAETGNTPSSQVGFLSCTLGMYGYSLTNVAMTRIANRWTANDNHPHEDLSGDCPVVNLGDGMLFHPKLRPYPTGALTGIVGIGGPGAKIAGNLCGTGQITGSALGTSTSFSVVFPLPEIDSNYDVVVNAGTIAAGTPALGANRIRSIAKARTGFTVHVETDPGSGNTQAYDWHLMRHV